MDIRKNLFAAMAASMLMYCLSGCTVNEELANQDEEIGQGMSKLKLTTKADGESTSPKESKIYLFDKYGDCTHIIETNNQSDNKTIIVPSGKHKMIAVGSDNLSQYILPDMEHANDTSIIKLKEGKALNNLLLKSVDTDLNEGETTNVGLDMARQVICIKKVEIEKVPTDVTSAVVTIAPMYKNIRMNEQYTNETDTIKITLTKDDSTGKWTYKGDSIFSLPSKGNPTTVLRTTSSDAIKEYSYKNNTPFSKNRFVALEVVYNEGLKTYLSVSLTEPAWEGTDSVKYEFSEENVTYEEYMIPIEGKTYNKYYVVSANAENNTAVLLRRTGETGINEKTMNEKATSIDKPNGATIDHWRLPTRYECRKILKSCDIFYPTDETSKPNNYQITEGLNGEYLPPNF